MFNIFSNNKGITLVECLIAVVLTTIAIVSIMPMQSTAIKAASRSDYLGRAEGILQSQLELSENIIMNSTNTVTVGVGTPQSVTVSGLAGVSGDATFTIVTTISVNPDPGVTNSWIVNVKVTWTGNTTGITSSIIASR